MKDQTHFSKLKRTEFLFNYHYRPDFVKHLISLPSLLFGRIILIFQMGKVGSRSVESSLLNLFVKQGIFTRRHQFYYVPDNYGLRSEVVLCDNRLSYFRTHVASALEPVIRKVILWRAKLGLPLSVICPIREPIARDVSAFFYFYIYHRILTKNMSLKQLENIPLEELQRLFCQEHRPTDQYGPNPFRNDLFAEHSFSINWFDKHFKPPVNIDVYSRPFPVDRKWQIYRRGFTKVLLYRSDLEHSEQRKIISNFLNLELNELVTQNDSSKSIYADVYRKFKHTAKLPEQYIRQMHDSRFAKHFWSPEELKAAADKWR